MNRLQGPSLCGALVALTVVAYLPVWNNGFIDFDDDLWITRNPRVLAGLSWQGCTWAWTNDEAPYWIPLTWLSLQFDAHFFSVRTPEGEVIPSAAAFHAQNLFWHTGSVLLLFGFWYQLTGKRWRSFLVAGLFAVHPMHVESVAWAIERKDVLSGFFGILTLWAYARFAETYDWKWYLCAIGAFLLSLLSKPMLITLPFVLLLLDYWPLRRWGHSAKPQAARKQSQTPFGLLILEKLPLFLLALGIAAVTMESNERHGSLVPFSVISLSARLVNVLSAYGWYVSRTICPWGLAVLYPHPREGWSVLDALLGTATLLFITALCLWQARRQPWFIVGWLWFVGTLVPVIGLSQSGAQAWADRFSYWPHIGLFAALVWGAGELVDRFRIPALVSGTVGALVLASLTMLTWNQVGYWRDSQTLWEHALSVTENNDRAHEHLSRCYREQGRLEEADAQLVKAARIQSRRLNLAPP